MSFVVGSRLIFSRYHGLAPVVSMMLKETLVLPALGQDAASWYLPSRPVAARPIVRRICPPLALCCLLSACSTATPERGGATVDARPPVSLKSSPVARAGRIGDPATRSEVIPAAVRGDTRRSEVVQASVEQPASETDSLPPLPSEREFPVVPGLPADEGMPGNEVEGTLRLEEVIGSVYRAYPMLDAALRQRDIAAGDQLAAAGAYDIILPDMGVVFDSGVFIDFNNADVTSVTLFFYGGAAA